VRGGIVLAHSLVKKVNGYDILYWSLGGVYYFTDKNDNGKWLCEDKSLKVVEEFAKTL
jgi:hypothetical protein